jgi:hypothetical protein
MLGKFKHKRVCPVSDVTFCTHKGQCYLFEARINSGQNVLRISNGNRKYYYNIIIPGPRISGFRRLRPSIKHPHK